MKLALHYIFDPLCGWCYSIEPLISAAIARFGAVLDLHLHAGGLFPGPTRLSEQFRRHVVHADAHIAQLSGQTFSKEYLMELLPDPDTIFDSTKPIAAVLAAAEEGAARGFAMLAALQRAHYVHAQRIVEEDVIVTAAIQVGFDADLFRQRFAVWDGEPTRRHIANTRVLMSRVGVQGFPALALEQAEDYVVVASHLFYKKADAFSDHLAHFVR
jgi:putative protein-disulfide isomerase